MSQPKSQHYENLKKRHGDLLDAVENLGIIARRCGPLDEKSGQLIQLAAAAAIRSEGSVHSHAARAAKAGATPDEIRHAITILTSTIGFPTVAAALSWAEEVIGRQG